MATIKAYTDLEQSKKLAEILPNKTADMWYHPDLSDYPDYVERCSIGNIPCWSLASLLSVLPNNEHISTTTSRGSWKVTTPEYLPNVWWCQYEDTENEIEINTSADNLIDAIYKMIIRLNELNLL